jgi:hypothetical protein
MARYKFLGDDRYPNAGPCYQIKVKQEDGTTRVLTPISPATEFAKGVDIGYDLTDPVTVRYMNVDTRFSLI